ncbi:MAG: hypothetical protein ACRD3M_02710 [Thermoanaerobaculia bacterium]
MPISYYPQLRVPPGVPVWEPKPIPFGRMSQLAHDKLPAPAGLTVPSSLSVKLQGSWKQTGASPARWQFQGGDLLLESRLAVYIIDEFRPVKKLFELIMSHELLHVQDAIDILTRYMPEEVPRDEYVKKYLLEAQPVDDAMYRNWLQGQRFEQYVRDIWGLEWNRRGEARDSGPVYERYKLEVAKLLPRT